MASNNVDCDDVISNSRVGGRTGSLCSLAHASVAFERPWHTQPYTNHKQPQTNRWNTRQPHWDYPNINLLSSTRRMRVSFCIMGRVPSCRRLLLWLAPPDEPAACIILYHWLVAAAGRPASSLRNHTQSTHNHTQSIHNHTQMPSRPMLDRGLP